VEYTDLFDKKIFVGKNNVRRILEGVGTGPRGDHRHFGRLKKKGSLKKRGVYTCEHLIKKKVPRNFAISFGRLEGKTNELKGNCQR